MFANKDAASSSAAGQSGKDVSGEVQAEKSMDKLNVREFCERFCISNGVSVQLVDGEAYRLRNLRTMLSISLRSNSKLGFGYLSHRCSKNFSTSPRSPRLTSIPTWSGC